MKIKNFQNEEIDMAVYSLKGCIYIYKGKEKKQINIQAKIKENNNNNIYNYDFLGEEIISSHKKT